MAPSRAVDSAHPENRLLASLPTEDRDRLIRLGRGRVTVRDAAKLENACCECYRAVRDEFDRFLP